MATQHNVFVRKFGKMAVVITVTDWEDFKELEQHMTNKESGDLLLTGVTTKSIYSNMQPSMQLNTYKAIDISEGTKGMGLAGIITEGCDYPGDNNQFADLMGGIWAYRKAGLTVAEEFSKPQL
jgi:hypothetical protein